MLKQTKNTKMCVSSRTLCATLKWLNMSWGNLDFDRKKLEPKEFPWQRPYRCHLVSFAIPISGAKFEEHCFNISRDVLYSVFYHFVISTRKFFKVYKKWHEPVVWKIYECLFIPNCVREIIWLLVNNIQVTISVTPQYFMRQMEATS